MSEIKTLLFLELRSFYGINKLLHTKDPKIKKRYKMLSIVWVLLIGMLFTYVGGLVYGLCFLGLSAIVPAYLAVISSSMIVFLGMFTAGNRIFGQKGYDILASFPVKSSSIVISRFLGLYIAELVLTAVITLPGIVVYGYLIKPNVLFYLFAVIGTIFIPIIPLVISTLLGTLIMAASSRMKNKSMMQSVLSVILVIGIMSVSYGMEGLTQNFSAEQFGKLAETVLRVINKTYPPAIWVNSAVIEIDILSLLLFMLISLVTASVALWIVNANYNSIVRRLLNFSAKHNYKMGKIQSRSILKALYFKEAKRYFASSIYVTNTIIGPVLGTIMSIALCVVGIDTIEKSLPFSLDIPNVLPFAFSAVFCMMTTSSVSISMEGKQFWIVKALPITTKNLLDSKILFNLSLMLPFYCISQIAFIIAIKPSVSELLSMLIIPLTVMTFVVVFGIAVNLKFNSFDWAREEAVVKQSLSAGLGGFAGFFVSILLGGITLVTPSQYSIFIKISACVIFWIITIIMYNKNNTKKLADL